MALDSRGILYTVVITGLKDEASGIKVAEALVRVTKEASFEQIRGRLRNLPWTLTRKATATRAAQVVRLLERRGATTLVIPPLPATPLPHATETQVLPGTELLSTTQIMSATQFIPLPTEHADIAPAHAKSPVGPPTLPPTPPVAPPKGPPKAPEPPGGGGFRLNPFLWAVFWIVRFTFVGGTSGSSWPLSPSRGS